MSIKSKIDCPDCQSPIHFESTLLLAGQSFKCTNPECHTSISLGSEQKDVLSNAFDQYEKMRADAMQQSGHAS